MPTFFQTLDTKTPQPKADKQPTFHFSPFNCLTLSAVLLTEKRAYPENLHVVFCHIKQAFVLTCHPFGSFSRKLLLVSVIFVSFFNFFKIVLSLRKLQHRTKDNNVFDTLHPASTTQPASWSTQHHSLQFTNRLTFYFMEPKQNSAIFPATSPQLVAVMGCQRVCYGSHRLPCWHH